MEPYAQYQQQPSAYPHPHQQATHPNQTSPGMQAHQPNYAQHQQPQQMAYQPMMPQMGYGHAYPMQQSQVTPSQAAAMATAAASGYPTYSMPDSSQLASMPQTSPRMQQVKADGTNMQRPPEQSPRQQPQMMPGQMPPGGQPMPNNIPQMQQQQRRMSHAGSPAVQVPQQQAQPPMNAPPRPSVPPQQAPPQQSQQPPHQSPEVPAPAAVEESPLYVNAKQFHRILKRRMARQKLEEALRLTNKGRKPYLHESRHNHAMRRPRGPGGRFLTAEEVSQLENKDGANGHAEGMETNGGGMKRKADSLGGAGVKSETPTKKVKSDEEDEDDDEEQDEDG